MNSCDKFIDLISRSADNDLNPAEERELADHLKTCDSCKKLYNAFSILSDSISDSQVNPPDDMKDNIMSAITIPPTKTKHWKSWLAVAACFAVVIFCTTKLAPISKTNSASIVSSGYSSTEGKDELTNPREFIESTQANSNASCDAAVEYSDSVCKSIALTSIVSINTPTGDYSLSKSKSEALSDLLSSVDLSDVGFSNYDYAVHYSDGNTLKIGVDTSHVYLYDESSDTCYIASCSANDLLTIIDEIEQEN